VPKAKSFGCIHIENFGVGLEYSVKEHERGQRYNSGCNPFNQSMLVIPAEGRLSNKHDTSYVYLLNEADCVHHLTKRQAEERRTSVMDIRGVIADIECSDLRA